MKSCRMMPTAAFMATSFQQYSSKDELLINTIIYFDKVNCAYSIFESTSEQARLHLKDLKTQD